MFNLFNLDISPEGWRTIRKVLVGLLVVVGLVGGGYYYGKQSAENDQLEAKNQQLQKYASDIVKLTEERDALQKKQQERIVVKEIVYVEKVNEINEELEANVDALRRGNLRLSVRLRDLEASAATSELTAGVVGRHASRRAELHEEVATTLLRIGRDADVTAVRLGQCQMTLNEFYLVVDEYNTMVKDFYQKNGYTF